MKKHLAILMVTIVVSIILISCKKSNNPKDYAASIINKTWWGVLTYTGQTEQYYSAHFNADKTLLWSQLSGDYDGQWDVSAKQLTIILTPGVQITTNISDDDKLTSITDNTAAYEINNGQLIGNPNLILDNTKWKGTYFNGSTSSHYNLVFHQGQVLPSISETTRHKYMYIQRFHPMGRFDLIRADHIVFSV